MLVEVDQTEVLPPPAPQSEAVVWSRPLTLWTQKVPALKLEIASDEVVAAPPEETVNWLLLPTVNNWLGLVVPMPTLPFFVTLNNEVPEVEEISNGSMAEIPVTDRRAAGE